MRGITVEVRCRRGDLLATYTYSDGKLYAASGKSSPIDGFEGRLGCTDLRHLTDGADQAEWRVTGAMVKQALRKSKGSASRVKVTAEPVDTSDLLRSIHRPTS